MSNMNVVDQEARNMALSAQNQIQSHERECAVRWSGTMSAMKEIKAILAWGTVALIGSMGTLILLLLSRTH